MIQKQNFHKSVMVSEVLDAFRLKPFFNKALLNHQNRFIDATLGGGGHSLEILKRGGQVLGIEMDDKMLEYARKRLVNQDTFKVFQGNFKDIKKIAEKENFSKVDGILFDLGISNIQLTSLVRGFSFSNPKAILDMRINNNSGPTASDLLNILREDQLEDLFSEILTHKESNKLAKKITKFRTLKKIRTVGDFLEICQGVLLTKDKIHPTTRAFLALRIAVNSELDNLKQALPAAFDLLKPKGRLVVISFHSGEDAIVKSFMNFKVKSKEAFLLNKKPIIPKQEEINENPKSRSAKLRILEKI